MLRHISNQKISVILSRKLIRSSIFAINVHVHIVIIGYIQLTSVN